ncbi:hypothetical protein XELAEV_18003846mg [Xenopus laevis]|nr:hypothetical protein XELAEV_18003846mg [Xenopus laevis]
MWAPSKIWGGGGNNKVVSSFGLKGTYKCGRKKCTTCRFVAPRSFKLNGLPKVNVLIIYGKAIRKVDIRIAEHLQNIRAAKINHSIPQHFKETHGCDPTGLSFRS